MKRPSVTLLLAGSFLAALPLSAFAQVLPSEIGAVNAAPGAMTGKDFAQAVLMSDKFEVDEGQLAAQQAVSPAVRAFARRMVKAHSAITAQLKSVVDRTVVGPQVTLPPELNPRDEDMYNRLEAAHGIDFDRMYVSQQRAAHREALAVYEGYAANGEVPELRRFAAETIPIIEQHIAMLRNLRGEGRSASLP